MSRVADALRLANRETPGADAFTADAHPWGRDLGAADGGPQPAWSTEGNRACRQPDLDEDAAMPAALRGTEALREPAGIQTTSPLSDLDPSIRQQIAGVVERVFLPISGQAPRMVAFAGVDADARSGWIAAAVADMLAQRTAARIAIVDMNFANPHLHECFGIRRTPGVTEALDSDTPFLQSAWQVRGNLWAIPAGGSASTVELTAGSAARISRLATTLDHVVVSLEPLAGWCGGGLPTLADGIVLVIASEATRRQVGHKVAERLHASGAAILGAVLTNRRYVIPEAIYKRL